MSRPGSLGGGAAALLLLAAMAVAQDGGPTAAYPEGHVPASTRKLAEEGLTRMLNEAIEPLLAAVKPLQKIFLEGAVCPSGCVAPEVVEIKAELEKIREQTQNIE